MQSIIAINQLVKPVRAQAFNAEKMTRIATSPDSAVLSFSDWLVDKQPPSRQSDVNGCKWEFPKSLWVPILSHGVKISV